MTYTYSVVAEAADSSSNRSNYGNKYQQQWRTVETANSNSDEQ